MLEHIDDVLARLYPTRTWGEARDDDAEGMAAEDLSALAEELALELKAATFVRAPDDAEPCDMIYVLALGRAPCILQVRDHDVAIPDEWKEVEPGSTEKRIDELYLRVVISQRARVAAVQQVAVTALRGADGTFTIHEAPRAGVYDAPLLARMQKLVAILPAYEVMHVDFGEIAHAPPGFHAGSWTQLYGGAPSIANYLFYPQPTTMTATVIL
jgi:hypothetical protein